MDCRTTEDLTHLTGQPCLTCAAVAENEYPLKLIHLNLFLSSDLRLTIEHEGALAAKSASLPVSTGQKPLDRMMWSKTVLFGRVRDVKRTYTNKPATVPCADEAAVSRYASASEVGRGKGSLLPLNTCGVSATIQGCQPQIHTGLPTY